MTASAAKGGPPAAARGLLAPLALAALLAFTLQPAGPFLQNAHAGGVPDDQAVKRLESAAQAAVESEGRYFSKFFTYTDDWAMLDAMAGFLWEKNIRYGPVELYGEPGEYLGCRFKVSLTDDPAAAVEVRVQAGKPVEVKRLWEEGK
jgi:hypothetical protein